MRSSWGDCRWAEGNVHLLVAVAAGNLAPIQSLNPETCVGTLRGQESEQIVGWLFHFPYFIRFNHI